MERVGAVAIFVKTPGLSSVKTRLAKETSTSLAQEFYLHGVSVIESIVAKTELIPYWAVAEDEGQAHSLWSRFNKVSQGGDSLGHRLHHVYSTLLEKHPFVLLIGADSPLLTPEILTQASVACLQGRFTVGKTEDGGFYLFGGSQKLSKESWLNVPYSVSATADSLLKNLKGEVSLLPELFDVDVKADLTKLKKSLNEIARLLPAQKKLKEWLNSQNEI